MVVVDASLLVDAFLGDVTAEDALNVDEMHAPVTIDAEVLHAMRRLLIRGVMTLEQSERVLETFRQTAIIRHPAEPLVPRMWQLRHNVSAYDAAYVALAESLGMTLLTRDRRLAQSSGHAARIEYID